MYIYIFLQFSYASYSTAPNKFSATDSNMQFTFARFFATNTGFSIALSRQ